MEVVRSEQVRREFRKEDRLDVPTDGLPSVGPADAPITLVDVTSFTCPFCLKSRLTLRQLKAEYGDELRVVTGIRLIGPDANPPARAACAAKKQGRFHEYAELLWSEAQHQGGDFRDENLRRLADEAGLDLKRFAADFQGDECTQAIAAESDSLNELGLYATPTWVINGRVIRGIRPIEQYREAIDEELAGTRS